MTAYETIRDAIRTVIQAADSLVPADNIYDYLPMPLDTTPQNIYSMFGVETVNGKEIRAYTFYKLNRPVDQNFIQGGSGDQQEREIDETWRIEFYRTKLDPVNEGSKTIPNSEYDFQNTVENLVDEFWEHPAMSALKRLNIRAVVSSTAVPEINFRYMTGEELCHYAAIDLGIHYNRYVSP